jgi:hypothetical protein
MIAAGEFKNISMDSFAAPQCIGGVEFGRRAGIVFDIGG